MTELEVILWVVCPLLAWTAGACGYIIGDRNGWQRGYRTGYFLGQAEAQKENNDLHNTYP